jgi:hypothetical protein
MLLTREIYKVSNLWLMAYLSLSLYIYIYHTNGVDNTP